MNNMNDLSTIDISTFSRRDSRRIRNKLVSNTADLIFRRVESVDVGPTTHVRYHDVHPGAAAENTPTTCKVYEPHPGVSITYRDGTDLDVYEVTDAVWPEQHTELFYAGMFVTLSEKPQLSKDKRGGTSFSVTELTMSAIDIFSPTSFVPLLLECCSKSTVLGYRTPDVGSLVACRVNSEGIVEEWAPVSEQFFRLWRYLHYKNVPFKKGARKGHELAMSRSVLETNTFRRLTLAHHQNGSEIPFHILQSSYSVANQELAATDYCHIYVCIYLLAVRCELPSQKNIPLRVSQKLPEGVEPKFAEVAVNLKTPDIPPYFVHALIHMARS